MRVWLRNLFTNIKPSCILHCMKSYLMVCAKRKTSIRLHNVQSDRNLPFLHPGEGQKLVTALYLGLRDLKNGCLRQVVS